MQNKNYTVYKARAELSETWYPRCQFPHLEVLFWFISQTKKIKNCIYLSTTESTALDFSPVINNIFKIVLLDANFGLHFGIWVQVKSRFQIRDFISMINISYSIAVLITLKQGFVTSNVFLAISQSEECGAYSKIIRKNLQGSK